MMIGLVAEHGENKDRDDRRDLSESAPHRDQLSRKKGGVDASSVESNARHRSNTTSADTSSATA